MNFVAPVTIGAGVGLAFAGLIHIAIYIHDVWHGTDFEVQWLALGLPIIIGAILFALAEMVEPTQPR